MTVQHDQTGVALGSSGGDQSTAGRVADTAKSEASNVASTAAEGARDVASEAGAQARAVADEAKQQLDRLMSQGRDEVRQQAEQRTSQAAGQLRTLSEQFSALLEGRPEASGPLVGFAGDLQGQLRRLAARMEQGGPQGVIDDVTSFARRRPGVFLAGAAGVGFVVGRLVRAGAANQRENGPSTGDALATPPNGPVYEEPTPLPPPVHSAGSVP
jgi:vacuolar-type H+-ATPase subunit H